MIMIGRKRKIVKESHYTVISQPDDSHLGFFTVDGGPLIDLPIAYTEQMNHRSAIDSNKSQMGIIGLTDDSIVRLLHYLPLPPNHYHRVVLPAIYPDT
jgi:hypothetical protein